jgi:xanthine dehydrogenase accessory factor
MSEVFFEKMTELHRRREPFALATVIRIEGSASAKPGAKAIIDKNGKTLMGWVGGGCAESAVCQQALASLEDEQTRIVPIDLDDEVLGVGMPCGGMMEVYVEPYLPKPELLIVGHGRIAESLAMLGKFLDFFVTINDPVATKEIFPTADRLVTDDQDFSQMHVNPNSYVVVVTQHKGDHLSIKKALEGHGAYIALVASKKTICARIGILIGSRNLAGRVGQGVCSCRNRYRLCHARRNCFEYYHGNCGKAPGRVVPSDDGN